VNTVVTRIQDRFQQGAETVIIDARNSGLTVEQALEATGRATGTYSDKILPGNVEIWTQFGKVK